MTKHTARTGKHPRIDEKKKYRIKCHAEAIRDTRRWLKCYKKDLSEKTGVDVQELEDGVITDKNKILSRLSAIDEYFGLIPPETENEIKVVFRDFRRKLFPIAKHCAENVCAECDFKYSPLKGFDSCILKRPPYQWPLCQSKALCAELAELRQMCIFARCSACPFKSYMNNNACSFKSVVPALMEYRIRTALDKQAKPKERKERKRKKENEKQEETVQ